MKYHAIVEYSKTHYYWNLNKQQIIDRLLIPFINGQVILISPGNNKVLLNLRSVSRLTFFRTKTDLEATEDKSVIDQLKESDFKTNECTEKLIQESKLDLTSQQTFSLLQKSFATPKNQVFVIMKFGDKSLDSAFEGVIEPLCQEFGLEVIRVDKIQDSGKISDQILDLISESRFILSDLTGSRPNCYYETGFAHALGKEIILTCNKEETIHFDLSGYRFIIWDTESDFRRQLKARIHSLVT